MKVVIMVSFATLFVSSSSHGDSGRGPKPTLPPATVEPTTDSPAMSAAGAETPGRDPFSPYEIGPQGTRAWRYEELSKDERTQASLGRKVQLQAATIDAYGAAIQNVSHRAAGDAAARKLGLEHLGLIGVVP